MSNQQYNEDYINAKVAHIEDVVIAYEDIEAQKYILTDGSKFKCHVDEIDATMFGELASSFEDQEDEI